MKLLKLTVGVAVSAFLVGAGTVAHAQGGFPAQSFFDVFVFDAAPGYSTALDGSTITIKSSGTVIPSFTVIGLGDSISSWDLKDSAFDIEMTPQNSQVNFEYVIDFGHLTWGGSFNIGGTDTIVQRQADFTGVGFPGGGGSLEDTVDPPGYWIWQSSTPVPDALNSFQLFALALAALGAAHLFFRRQTAMLGRN